MDEKERQNPTSNSTSDTMSLAGIESWAMREYRRLYCDGGKAVHPLSMDNFQRQLQAQRPADSQDIGELRNEVDIKISAEICNQFALDQDGHFKDQVDVVVTLHNLRPDLAERMMVGEVVDMIEKNNLCLEQPAQTAPETTLRPLTNTNSSLAQEPPPPAQTKIEGNATVSPASASASSLQIPTATEPLQTSQHKVTVNPSASHHVEAWVREVYNRCYCDRNENLIKAPNFIDLQVMLNRERPADNVETGKAVKKLELELANKPLSPQDAAQIYMLAQTECDKYIWTDENCTTVRGNVVSALLLKRPDVHLIRLEAAVMRAENARQARNVQPAAPTTISQGRTSTPRLPVQSNKPVTAFSFMKDGFNLATDHGMKAWIYLQYAHLGFGVNGAFKGYPRLVLHVGNLKALQPGIEGPAIAALNSIRRGKDQNFRFDVVRDGRVVAEKGLQYFRQQAEEVVRRFRATSTQTQRFGLHGMASGSQSTLQLTTLGQNNLATAQQSATQNLISATPPSLVSTSKNDLLAKKLNQLQKDSSAVHENSAGAIKVLGSDRTQSEAMDSLLSADFDEMDDDQEIQNIEVEDMEVQQAPLVTASILAEDHGAVLPQYGLLGSYEKEKIFLNTNVPFSAFICGVQGSGKSHTTSCILENALIPSSQLGSLKKPLSALVFSYGPFSGDGSGYSISETAFLAAPHVNFPSHPHVGKIRVLVSPSNYVKLARLYLRVPNVSVSKFKLKPGNLDIDIMLTLMNVNETAETPLYMAAVTQLLRQMATEGSSFSYFAFKARLKTCRFNPVQVNMLCMRLELLESFLDLDNSCAEPQFAEGEITIIDLSCPFVDANTACVLFRIGLQRYLQSRVAGKMIVLDEAHKYMLPNPGAKALNEALRTIIRMQRHYGARVVISTQELTLLTDLIALCSVTVVHRFSSPEWFASIKRHIPMRADEFDMVMKAIESLKTGTALVYAPNAALGRDEVGTLVKGTGRLMKLHIRKRVTSDGGQSVLAV